MAFIKWQIIIRFCGKCANDIGTKAEQKFDARQCLVTADLYTFVGSVIAGIFYDDQFPSKLLSPGFLKTLLSDQIIQIKLLFRRKF